MASHTSDKKYKNSFVEKGFLGIGGFSTVFKSKHISEDKMYAIKKVGYNVENEEAVLKEFKILAQLDSEYIVKCADYWIEPNYYIGSFNSESAQNISSSNLLYSPNFTHLLHIQMELCSLTLRDAINKIVNECKTTDNTLTLVGYFVASELLNEILECVQYLHQQNPAIIHRDLKPENILLTNFVNNRFVRLGDFGLSTLQKFADQSHTKHVGTIKYIAPEVHSGHYTTKVDNYSLGVIIQELFDINFSNNTQTHLPVLEGYMYYLKKLVERLLSPNPGKRPECADVLNESFSWRVNFKLISDKKFKEVITKSPKSYSIENNFVEFFIQKIFQEKLYPKMNILQINHNYAFQRALTQTLHSNSPAVQPQSIVKTSSANNDFEYEYYTVTLTKSELGFGFLITVKGGESIVISAITHNGVAHRDGILKVGDEIIEINNRNIRDFKRIQEVDSLIVQSESTLCMLVRRKSSNDAKIEYESFISKLFQI